MSRAAGSVPVTSLPPMAMCPPLVASRPASARSVVDFPQPDGPTSTRNSPSAMCRSRSRTLGRSAPGYWIVTSSNFTSAMGKMILQDDEAPPQPTLECRTMPESNVPGALGHNPLSTGPLGSRVKWWRDPGRRLQFLVISLLFLLLALPEIGVASGQSGGWQAPILLAGLAISYAGLVVQQWRVELGVAIIAAGLALSALSGGVCSVARVSAGVLAGLPGPSTPATPPGE